MFYLLFFSSLFLDGERRFLIPDGTGISEKEVI
jgi:hypothetical protein